MSRARATFPIRERIHEPGMESSSDHSRCMPLHLRYYGEPDWSWRPHKHPSLADDCLPLTTDESYEEWRVRQHICQALHRKRESSRTSLLGLTEIVDVLVGKSAVCFRIHKSLFMNDSGFAKTCFSVPMCEKQSDELRLPEHEVQIFDIYVRYLYTSVFTGTEYQLDDLLKMYVLGDQLDSTRFLDMVFDVIFKQTASPFCRHDITQIDYVMRNTSTNSPLRNLFIDYVGRCIVDKTLKFGNENTKLPAQYKAEFMDGVANALELRDMTSNITALARERYPNHRKLGGRVAGADDGDS